jgi:diaminopimelate decarboxylase
VAIESEDEAARLAAFATALRTRVDVLLRFNPDVTPETHPGLAVGSGDSKFGLAEDELARAVDAGGGPDGPLRWRGLHVHVGSQLGAVDSWRDAVRRAIALLSLMRGGLPDFTTLDVGGGFPVAPVDSTGPDGGPAVPSPARFARELDAVLEAVPEDRRPARLAVEPGRFLVARAGWLVGRVLHARERGGRPLVVLDTGMTELLRPALYGANHPIVALTSLGRDVAPGTGDLPGSSRETRVDGPICESTDRLGVHRLPPLRRGDLIAIRDAGAYGSVLGSTYNGRPRPPHVILEPDGRLTLGRRRGTIARLG